MGSAIVLGASGFIGTRLVRRLVETGVSVRALDIAPPREQLPSVTYETADVRRPLDLGTGGPGEGVDAIYNLAAVHRTPGHQCHEYYETNVLGSLNAVALAERLGCETLVFTSSISVYGPTEAVVTEASAAMPTSDYGRSKFMAEQIHRAWCDRSPERRLVIVRPGVVFGPGEGGNYSLLARALRRGLFAYPGRRTTIKSGGHVDELLACLEFALARPDRSVTFNFAYPNESTTEDIVRAFSAIAGFGARHPVVPTPLMMLGARLCSCLSVVGLPNPLHPDRVMKLVQSTRIVPAWLQANGYVFGTDLLSGLERWRDETAGSFQ